MKFKVPRYFFGIMIIAMVIGCANKGTITGGEEDTQPPKIVREEPENYSTNFTGNEIYIYFDEYVKIKDLQKQLIISPPMDPRPTITPLGTAKKFIKIVIEDTLQPNTTYAFNFGQSIVDNNEGNPFSYYKYVFSTGNHIDSLSVGGQILSAGKREVDDFVSVMLYELDSTYTDSIVYKEKPRYITNTLDSTTTYSLENLKAGKYKLVALKDANSNFTFEQKTDKIGFYDGVVNIPTDSVYNLVLFNEDFDASILRSYQAAGQKIGFGVEGGFEDIEIKILADTPPEFITRLTKDKQKDTLYYWYKPKLEIDTTLFFVRNQTFRDTILHRFREMEKDSLLFKGINSGGLDFDKEFGVEANIPLVSINIENIKILDKDSIPVEFTTKFDSLNNAYSFQFEKSEAQNYRIEMLPETFEDFFGNTNDTLFYNVRTKQYSDYSNVRVNLNNAPYPVIVQLTDEKDVVKYEKIATSPGPLDFRNINTGNYFMRVIVDNNGNGEWDSGNYLKKIQPETIYYYDDKIETRANFDFVYEFTLPQFRPDPLKN